MCWKEDQSVSTWASFLNKDAEARNLTGRLGAIIGDSFIGEWFGVFGVVLPAIFAVVSFLILRIRTALMRKSFISLVLLMITGSAVASFLAPELNGIYGSSLGGGFGLFVNEWMDSLLGWVGTGVILLMVAVVWLVYTSKDSIKFMGMIFGALFDSIAHLFKAIFASKPRPQKRPLKPTLEPSKAAVATSITTTSTDATTPVEALEQQPKNIPTEEQNSQTTIDTFTISGSSTEPSTEPEPATDREPKFYIEGKESLLSDRLEPIEIGKRDMPYGEPNLASATPQTQNSVPPALPKATSPDDYTMAIDLNQAVFFNREIFDPEHIAPKEATAAHYSQKDISAMSDEELDRVLDSALIVTPKPESTPFTEPQKPYKPEGISLEIEPNAKTDFFEVSVTDNASINYEAIPQEENIRLTLNTSEQIDDSLIDASVFDPTLELSRYKLPTIDLLKNHTRKVTVTEEELYENKNKIVETLDNFSIKIDKIKATIGPTVTLYEIVPAPGVRISKIKNLEDDIALSLSALGIRIIAPIPGKGTIGIEVPNKDKEVVSMYSVIKSAKFQESSFDLPVVLGRTIQNEDYVFDLTKMPHLLVAGATGQGKSVGLNAIITSLLYKKHPSELKFVLVDPKKVELTLYANLEKHFLAKLPGEDEAIITDTQKVIFTLNSLCIEMDNRYDLLKKAKVRNIKEYNEKFTSRRLNPLKGHYFMPYFVVVIDEFADLIMTAGREIETPIARLAQLARAIGIHLVIATQRPTTNIITGVIKANFPARIAFRVSSMIDSRTILDSPGANQLIGRGDMLISNGNETTRVQCAFIDTPEVEKITEYIGSQQGYSSAFELPEYSPEVADKGSMEISGRDVSKRDGLFDEVARYVVTSQQGSASTIQRNFSIGFNRAGRIMDQLEKAGIVGKQDGSKPRQVLIQDLTSLELALYDIDNGNSNL